MPKAPNDRRGVDRTIGTPHPAEKSSEGDTICYGVKRGHEMKSDGNATTIVEVKDKRRAGLSV